MKLVSHMTLINHQQQDTYESQAIVVAEWNTLFNVIDGCCQTTENFTEITTHLH